MTTRQNRSSRSRQFSAKSTRSPTTADGARYPEIKQRGFYSDILGAEAKDKLGVRMLTFSICREFAF